MNRAQSAVIELGSGWVWLLGNNCGMPELISHLSTHSIVRNVSFRHFPKYSHPTPFYSPPSIDSPSLTESTPLYTLVIRSITDPRTVAKLRKALLAQLTFDTVGIYGWCSLSQVTLSSAEQNFTLGWPCVCL